MMNSALDNKDELFNQTLLYLRKHSLLIASIINWYKNFDTDESPSMADKDVHQIIENIKQMDQALFQQGIRFIFVKQVIRSGRKEWLDLSYTDYYKNLMAQKDNKQFVWFFEDTIAYFHYPLQKKIADSIHHGKTKDLITHLQGSENFISHVHPSPAGAQILGHELAKEFILMSKNISKQKADSSHIEDSNPL